MSQKVVPSVVAGTRSTDSSQIYHSRAEEAKAWRLLLLLGITGSIWLGFHWYTGVFLTPRNLTNLSVQMTVTALVSVAITWLLVAREIDLSVGSLLALCSVVSLHLQVLEGLNSLVTMILVLLLGVLVGLLQGGIRMALGIPSFIVTLAGFSWLRGTAFVVSGAETLAGTKPLFHAVANESLPKTLSIGLLTVVGAIGLFRWIRDFTPIFSKHPRPIRAINAVFILVFIALVLAGIWIFCSPASSGFPCPLLILLAVVLAAEYVTRMTRFGRYIYAVGGNPTSARRAGIPLTRITLSLFGIIGFMTALAGIIQSSRLDAGPPNVGQFLALDAISASIVGGTSLFGGVGSTTGSVVGALLIASITNGLSLAGVNTFYQEIITGVLLLGAVGFDYAAQKRVSV